jgi:NAD(P)-dependent dehydrogenase (short-subunit alcohol dehydrogenase family)
MRTPQSPIGSGFGPASTASDVVAGLDLSGKVAIVTGGDSGLGRETARALRSAGATVIVPTLDVAAAESALAGMDVELEPLDLLDPGSIDAFADKFLASGRPLHMLVNNAGIMAIPERTLDARGYEVQFVVNHLGPFQLTARLRGPLRQAKGARVVSVASLGHRYSPVFFDDPNYERRPYGRWEAYGQSKTAVILFTVALDARAMDEGVRAFSVHPGSIVSTGLKKYLQRDELLAGSAIDEDDNPIIDPSRHLKTIEMGAATTVWCATNPRLDGLGGVHCEDVDIACMMNWKPTATSIADSVILRGVMAHAIDPNDAERLWALSEKMLGLS